MKITNETPIQVHFDDLLTPTKITYMVYVDEKPVVLSEEDADKNTLFEIRELAGFGDWESPISPEFENEMERSDYEHVSPYYYTVKNGDFPMSFGDSDIPEHFYELGILMKEKVTPSGETVQVINESRDLGHGKQIKVIYSDGSEGWEHEEDLNDL